MCSSTEIESAVEYIWKQVLKMRDTSKNKCKRSKMLKNSQKSLKMCALDWEHAIMFENRS